ncbi:MAG TPA: hypothetical protein VFG34_05300 [Sphingopyxis sp.]|nr:hypothetical protein [Sphingopyxis sp.]
MTRLVSDRVRQELQGPLRVALIGALLLFLIGLIVPAHWISTISWQLYLDRLSSVFLLPVGGAGRMILALSAALFAFLLSLFVALLWPQPRRQALVEGHVDGRFAGMDGALPGQRIGRGAPAPDADAADQAADRPIASDMPLPPRSKYDAHPDDHPRAPIRAQQELPAGGLGPLWVEVPAAPVAPDASYVPDEDEAPAEPLAEQPDEADSEGVEQAEDRPWLQEAEASGPVRPPLSELSLSALVARLEAGLLHRRSVAASAACAPVESGDGADEGAGPVIPKPQPAPATVADHRVDLALEAALGTLQRMSDQAAEAIKKS